MAEKKGFRLAPIVLLMAVVGLLSIAPACGSSRLAPTPASTSYESTAAPTFVPTETPALLAEGTTSALLPPRTEDLTQTPAPMPTATPEPTPTATPAAAPTSGFRRVELDPNYWPSGAIGDEYVATGPDGEVYLLNISTGERRQLTDDGHRKRWPIMSENYVAWTDQRRQIEIPNRSSSQPEFTFADDIFVLDLATGEQRRITEVPANRYGLGISGHRLVWSDTRNELDGEYYEFDVYAYDLETDQEIPVAVRKGSQRSPVIYGDTVVWTDNRNHSLLDAPDSDQIHFGCGDCPANRFDIYSFDFSTVEEKPLIQTGYYNTYAIIRGDYVLWKSYHPEMNMTVKLWNLASGEELEISDDWRVGYLSLSDSYVVWTVGIPCDVVTNEGQSQGTGVFARSLATGEVWQLSDYVEPIARVYGKTVFIIESCQHFLTGRPPSAMYVVVLE